MTKRFVATALLLAISGAGTTVLGAPLDVFATSSPLGGGAFHWDISVVNDSVPDLFFVTVIDAPLLDPLIDASLTVPAGFLASYDDGLGFLDFLADATTVFPIGETSFFSFDSLAGPGAAFTSFQALGGAPPQTITGAVQLVAVPEPNPFGTLATGLGVLAFWLAVSRAKQTRGSAPRIRRSAETSRGTFMRLQAE